MLRWNHRCSAESSIQRHWWHREKGLGRTGVVTRKLYREANSKLSLTGKIQQQLSTQCCETAWWTEGLVNSFVVGTCFKVPRIGLICYFVCLLGLQPKGFLSCSEQGLLSLLSCRLSGANTWAFHSLLYGMDPMEVEPGVSFGRWFLLFVSELTHYPGFVLSRYDKMQTWQWLPWWKNFLYLDPEIESTA